MIFQLIQSSAALLFSPLIPLAANSRGKGSQNIFQSKRSTRRTHRVHTPPRPAPQHCRQHAPKASLRSPLYEPSPKQRHARPMEASSTMEPEEEESSALLERASTDAGDEDLRELLKQLPEDTVLGAVREAGAGRLLGAALVAACSVWYAGVAHPRYQRKPVPLHRFPPQRRVHDVGEQRSLKLAYLGATHAVDVSPGGAGVAYSHRDLRGGRDAAAAGRQLSTDDHAVFAHGARAGEGGAARRGNPKCTVPSSCSSLASRLNGISASRPRRHRDLSLQISTSLPCGLTTVFLHVLNPEAQQPAVVAVQEQKARRQTPQRVARLAEREARRPAAPRAREQRAVGQTPDAAEAVGAAGRLVTPPRVDRDARAPERRRPRGRRAGDVDEPRVRSSHVEDGEVEAPRPARAGLG